MARDPYWTFNSENGLKGVEGTEVELDDGRVLVQPDEDNPARLSDANILYALRTSQPARGGFCRDYPDLLPDEQERLTTLLEENPRPSAPELDEQRFCDRIQTKAIRSIPVRTSGRRGGKGGHGA